MNLKDALRDAELNSLGFTVMWFSNDEVMREIESVIEQIYLFLENVRADWVWALSSSAKSPLPLFAKEGDFLSKLIVAGYLYFRIWGIIEY